MKTFWQWLAVVVVGAMTAHAADITPGYTFSSGEANITHTKLNNAAAGTINTTFYSGKGSAGTDPNTAFTILIHNTTLDTFQKMPISSLLDHSSLLSGRTASTSLAVDDLILIYDFSAGAYRAISATNYFFGATETTAPTNETRIPVLAGGVLSSVTLSNLIAGATVNSAPTNNDRWLTLTASGAIKSLSAESFVKNQTAATNWGNYQSVAWDGTRLRTAYETNKIDGLTSTNTSLLTNDVFVVMQAGQLKKLFLNELRQWISVRNVAFGALTNTATLNPAGSWVDVTSVMASITPRATASKVLVTVTLAVDIDTNPAHFRILRGSQEIGVGQGSGNRTQAGASIDNASTLSVAMQWLDSPATTSSTTYKVQAFQSSGTVYINRSSSDADTTSNPRTVSTIMLEEIIQ